MYLWWWGGGGGGFNPGPGLHIPQRSEMVDFRLRVHVSGETGTSSVQRFNRGAVIAVVITVVNQMAQSC